MGKWSLLLIMMVCLGLAGITPVYAQAEDDPKPEVQEPADNPETPPAPSDEANGGDAGDADEANDDDAAENEGTNTPFQSRLKDRFDVTDEQIQDLREQKLGYGEINHVFTLADQMPGGITDDNVQKIMDMRQGGDHKVGWGKIAQDLDLKLKSGETAGDEVSDGAAATTEAATEKSKAAKEKIRTQAGHKASGAKSGNSHKPQTPSGNRGGGRNK